MAISYINTECKRYGCIKNLLACYANCRYSSRCDDLRNEISDKTEQAANDINSYLKERGKPPVMIQILKRGLKFADASIAAKKQIVKSVPSDFKSGAKSSEELRSRTVSKLEPRKFFASPRPEPARKSISRKPPKKTRALPVAELNASKATKPSVRIKTGRQTSYLENDLIASGSKAAEKGKKGREPRIIKKPPRAFKPRQRKNVIMPRKSNNESIEASGQKEPSANSSSNGIEHSKSVKSSRTRKRSGSSSRARASSRKGNLYIIVDGKSANIVDEQGLMQHLLTSPSASARYFEASEVEARVQIMPKK